MSEGTRDTFEEFIRNTNSLSDWITPLRGLSEDIAKDFREGIDVLFIDGDHSYTSVKKDLENWLPKMNKNARIILHDSGWAEGVKRAISEFVLPIQSENPIKWPNMYAVKINNLK
jgi:hypothetical protein